MVNLDDFIGELADYRLLKFTQQAIDIRGFVQQALESEG